MCALVSHLVPGNQWAAELAGTKTVVDAGDRLDGDLPGADQRRGYHASAATAPGALDALRAVSYGPSPALSTAATASPACSFTHGRDLAVGCGRDSALDLSLVDACHKVIAPHADLLHASGAFGARIEPEMFSDAQARLLAVLGRRA